MKPSASFTVATRVAVLALIAVLTTVPNPVSLPGLSGSALANGIAFDQARRDLGTVLAGSRATGTFTFVNEGQSAVSIEKVQLSSPALTANWSEAPVPPGDRGTVQLIYDSSREGTFSKRAMVTFTNGEQRALELSGRVEVPDSQ